MLSSEIIRTIKPAAIVAGKPTEKLFRLGAARVTTPLSEAAVDEALKRLKIPDRESLFVALAVRAVSQGRTDLAPRLFLAALACAIGFVLFKGFEYYELISAGIAVNSNSFFGFYFALTGLHLGHVIIGAVLLAVLAKVTRRPLAKPSHFALVESGGCFWHMVDLLWIIIFPLLYLVE